MTDKTLEALVADIRQWAIDGCYNDSEDGEPPMLMVHQTQQSYLAMADRIDAALAAQAQGEQAAAAWRPIAEAPRDGTPILGWAASAIWGPIAVFCFDGDERQDWTMDGYGVARNPTHYMPLPAAPSPESAEGGND